MRNASLPSPSTGSSNPEYEECPYLSGSVWRKEYLTDATYPHLVDPCWCDCYQFIGSPSSFPAKLLKLS